jgi:hypothetical protein
LSRAHAIDDEVVGFTQNGGWQKIDTVLPLVYGLNRFMPRTWMDNLRCFANNLKVSHLPLASAIEAMSDIKLVAF